MLIPEVSLTSEWRFQKCEVPNAKTLGDREKADQLNINTCST